MLNNPMTTASQPPEAQEPSRQSDQVDFGHLHEWDRITHGPPRTIKGADYESEHNCEVCTVPGCGIFRCEVE